MSITGRRKANNYKRFVGVLICFKLSLQAHLYEWPGFECGQGNDCAGLNQEVPSSFYLYKCVRVEFDIFAQNFE